MQLIKITEQSGKKVVSSIDLYNTLGLASQHYAKWCSKNIINSHFAIEDEDYISLPLRGRSAEYALSIEFAKRLSMMARTEQGEKVRQYFIECEKEALHPKKLPSAKELAQMVIQAEEEKERVVLQLNQANQTIKDQAPKVEYVEKVLSSVGTYHATSIASDFGLSAIMLNKKLKSLGIQRKIDGHWVLNAQYQSKGYEDFRTVPYLNSRGEQCTAKEMVWTEKGRKFIHDLIGMQQTG